VVLVVALVSACAPKIVPAPVVTVPQFPDFVAPAIPEAQVGSPVALAEDRGWRFLQSGDPDNAERELTAALRAAPAFYPADAALGYVELARKRAKSAVPHFDAALAKAPGYVAALVGKGEALVALARDRDAVPVFEAALAADPSLIDVKRRLEVLRFRSAEQTLASARAAARAGRPDEAERIYSSAIASSPDSPFLYRELAAVERQKGNDDAALDHLKRAAALDPSDAKSLEQMGEIYEARGELEAAEKAFSDSLAIDANADVERRLDLVREREEIARLPAEYRAIDQAPQITRGDLAALVGIRLGPLLQERAPHDAVLITDVRGSWASTWIMAVARAGVMEPFANHAFQPRSVVRRTDLAQVVARLLARITTGPNAERARTWEAARLKFSDLAAGHLAYPAASAAVASGAMKTAADGSFEPSRPATGAEAEAAIDRLGSVAGIAGVAPKDRP
jgi:tetratricopeptide (TPR) repeat protein